MKNLSSEHGKFLCFFIRYFRNRFCILYKARVSRHNAVNVFPGLNFINGKRRANHRCRKVTSAASKSRNVSGSVFCYKAGNNRNCIVRSVFVSVKMRRNSIPHIIKQFCRHIMRIAYKTYVPGIVEFCRNPNTVQVCSHHTNGHPLAE